MKALPVGAVNPLVGFRSFLLAWRGPRGHALSPHSVSNVVTRIRRVLRELPAGSSSALAEYIAGAGARHFRRSDWALFHEYARGHDYDVPSVSP